jgi:Major capsid protein N-terminus/Large eukaryotic DNA virus major capsid protein
MPGGLMNLASEGQQNIILNGNPQKSFWKGVWSRYTNYGLQKFRMDYEGSNKLRLTEESTYTFKIKRYADLLTDCYLSVDLPNIWSPVMPPITTPDATSANSGIWVPYEFKWIENIGAKMISNISITCGGQTLQEFSGSYLLAMVQRDFSQAKKDLFDKMTGNVPELNDPANSGTRVNSYPNAYYTESPVGSEPSIRGRTLYIPLNTWFTLKTQMAFPLVSLQYNELQISVTLRPIQELFQIRDVFDSINNYPYIAPNFNAYYMQFYRFLQSPPTIQLGPNDFSDQRTLWNADVHLVCTYCFLSNEESRLFALQEQSYLIRQVNEQVFYNVTGPNKVQLTSSGVVSNCMFYFQRSDANLRNEWSNYTNWPYNYLPYDIIPASTDGKYPIKRTNPDGSTQLAMIGPGVNADGHLTGWYITGDYNLENQKDILVALGILLDGAYRENLQPAGIYNYIEKYTRTAGNGPDGLYCYNFCNNTNPLELQPTGGINMSRFNTIELEFTTIIPALDPLAQSLSVCDPETGVIVGVNKPSWRIYIYNYDMYYFEERYNLVSFVGGNVGLMYAT